MIGIKDLTQSAIKCLLDLEIEHYKSYWKTIEGLSMEKFKNEMRRFNIDHIKEEHKDKVLKLILRILNAKLIR